MGVLKIPWLVRALLVLQLLAEVDIEDAEIDEVPSKPGFAKPSWTTQVYAASLLRYAEDVSTARHEAGMV